MQMTTRSKMWLLDACCLVCGCGGGGSGQKILHLGVICQHTLDPGGLCCALTLLTNSDISLCKNTHIQPPSSFNILIPNSLRSNRVGYGKIYELGGLDSIVKLPRADLMDN